MPPLTRQERDERFLSRAVDLAAEALGRTSPNPMVGAVIVKDDDTIGEGYHAAAGEPHAERMALASCREDPAGATMYVSLEPCAHEGRTPPCVEAILEAGIARVVVASDDPTGKASGRAFGILRDEGVRVEMGGNGSAQAARILNQPFRKHARVGRPLVILKSAMTLDGKVATSGGDSKWISGEESRARGHRWRATVDAVAAGIGTALTDDPMLTAWMLDEQGGAARRVIFDSEARLPVSSQLVRTAAEAPVTLICGRAASRPGILALEAAGVEVIMVAGENEGARLRSALDELGARDVQSVLLEGGPHLAGAFFDAGEVDEVRAFVAPIVAGGRSARPPVEGQGVEAVGEAPRALSTDVERIGEDVLITARLKEW
ncbi:MAG: bifunctional diaminohydroxyphosphoribosylaminopyrimidine deaminase/5-amino-6-(5-phosphoribosylamino)uracil reductase RibD [Thermoleophilaceae bacterium]|jgi:diaminohydroxyphosphoribosylaminopyrimidine deaminase/5-amino-6-(5-phosphoribosylamino)uracil reductase|nr:bifunctional diaminohydroxyphosphoribosylaminopyrimidine deaminase/5-amino-6-(5-phosphoribosylamino)uracil reductase RibD [Thermoleophilaceae bacterium]MBA3840678.1 bifunctional diaminohydroxyphosphoribosylaminopyrimidine deaminase/5-amino-6-(5-phosphoribosylamino)uracil reductase RibD [Thermoleophilaceae bacterium]